MEGRCVLCTINLLLLLGGLLVLDVLDALAGDVCQRVGNFLPRELPISGQSALWITVQGDLIEDQVTEGIEHIWDLDDFLELVGRLLFLERDVQNLQKRDKSRAQFKLKTSKRAKS